MKISKIVIMIDNMYLVNEDRTIYLSPDLIKAKDFTSWKDADDFAKKHMIKNFKVIMADEYTP